MGSRKFTLLIDALINLILGVFLLLYSENLAALLGVPIVENYFYPNILGGIFIGIALALYFETQKKTSKPTTGLGLIGLGLAWKWELIGGIIALVAFTVIGAMEPTLFVIPLVYFYPGTAILFIVLWAKNRKHQRESKLNRNLNK